MGEAAVGEAAATTIVAGGALAARGLARAHGPRSCRRGRHCIRGTRRNDRTHIRGRRAGCRVGSARPRRRSVAAGARRGGGVASIAAGGGCRVARVVRGGHRRTRVGKAREAVEVALRRSVRGGIPIPARVVVARALRLETGSRPTATCFARLGPLAILLPGRNHIGPCGERREQCECESQEERSRSGRGFRHGETPKQDACSIKLELFRGQIASTRPPRRHNSARRDVGS
jgi:hypothetical protein